MTSTSSERYFEASFATDPVADGDARDTGRSLRRLERLATLLDDRYVIPGTNFRFGLDAVIGLLPGVGDLAGAALSSYIVLESRRLGVPKRVLLKMAKNVAVDAAFGAVPIIGDLADIQWKANRRNVHLVIEHLRGKAPPPPPETVAG